MNSPGQYLPEKTSVPTGDFTELQQLRYTLAGAKGGDGDPPYALNMSMLVGKKRSQYEETGVFRYAREGD